MPIVAILFLTAVNLLNYFDRYIVQAVEPTITAEFALTNTEAGYLVSAFVLGYFIFSPVFGFLGDRFDRRWIMAIGLVGWSIATAMTAMATTVGGFGLARVLVGVGEAGYGALVPPYLKGRVKSTSDLNRALSIFYVAIPVGAALGYVAGGQVAANFGWRNLFLFAAIPGLALALGFLMLRPEVREQSTELSAEVPSRGLLPGLRLIARSPALCLVIIGYVLNTYALNGVAAFVVRHGTSLGLSAADASTYFGLILVVTGLLGTLGGGFLCSRRADKVSDPVAHLMRFVAWSTLLGVPFLAVCFLAKDSSLFLGACFMAELLIFAGVAPLNSVIAARAPEGYGALTQGVAIFAIQLFGGFLGPVTIGALTDMTGSLSLAMQGTSVAIFLSAYIWWRASKIV
jgi:predicted MFS family arabinose efflux permease